METRVKTQLTACDVLATGACASGVVLWLKRRTKNATAVDTAKALEISSDDERPYILKAANLDGYGYSDGNGGITS